MCRFSVLILTGLIACLLGITPVHGQSSYDLYGSARTSALGYAATALGSTAGVNGNPAAAASHRRRLASFYVRESFGIATLRYGAMNVRWPLDWGVFSGGASTFGGEEYREFQYSVGFAHSFQLGTSRHVQVGGIGRYYHTRIEKYGSAGAVGLHLGLLLTLLPALQLGIHATNINGPELVDGEALPQSLAVGLQYRATSRLSAVVDVFKDLSFPASVRAGVEVRPIPLLALRAGMTTSPIRFTGGVGIRLGRIQAHLAAEQHPDLGWSPSASLVIHW